jgi:hypothetical protein
MQDSYDVFISYSSRDADWVRGWLLPRLEAASLQVCIDYRDFDVGAPSLENMEQASERSTKTLIVITPNWIDSEWTNFEALLTQAQDPAARRRRIVPLMLQKAKLPTRLAMLTYADFTDVARHEIEIGRIIAAIKPGAKRGSQHVADPATSPKPSASLDAQASADMTQRPEASVTQSGGVNFGTGNTINIGGDIFGGDKGLGQPEATAATRSPMPDLSNPPNTYLVMLRENMTSVFSENDLQQIFFDLGDAWEDLPGQGRSAKVREMIAYYLRRGRLGELATMCESLRPKMNWRP